MKKIPQVTLRPDEEKELARRWKTSADANARDQLIFSCTGYVWAVAKKMCRNDEQLRKELIQEGFLGLFHAVEKYDPSFENRFATYALWWIRSSIKRYVKRMPLEASLDAPIADDADTTFKDMIPDERSDQEHLLGLNTEGDVQLLRQVASTLLHGNEWEVVRLRYFSEEEVITLEEVSRSVVGRSGTPITREAVRQLEAQAIKKLRNGLNGWEKTLEEKRRAKEYAGIPHHSHATEDSMSKIPEHAILSCLEKLGGKETYVTAADIAAALVKDDAYAGVATPFLIGQAIKHMVRQGTLLKRQSGSKRTYTIANEAGASKPTALAHADPQTPAPAHPAPLARTHEDGVFQLAIAMMRLGSELSADAIELSTGLRELSSGLQKIPEKYRERAIQVAKRINNK